MLLAILIKFYVIIVVYFKTFLHQPEPPEHIYHFCLLASSSVSMAKKISFLTMQAQKLSALSYSLKLRDIYDVSPRMWRNFALVRSVLLVSYAFRMTWK
jgi:hypothetical protein